MIGTCLGPDKILEQVGAGGVRERYLAQYPPGSHGAPKLLPGGC